MYERLENCPACKHTHCENHLITSDHSITKESFALVRCTKCHLIYTNPRPDARSISRYYQSDQYISHTNKSNSLINFIYLLARRFTLRSKYTIISRYRKHGTLLDYGCGTGAFLQFMKTQGWLVHGFEVDQDAAKQASISTNESVMTQTSQLQTSGSFDIITAWHVLEHVHDLKATLKFFRKKLNDKGHILIALPNVDSFDASYYKDFWAAYDVPRHLYHFNRESFSTLVNSCKLQISAILPMKLDAYYVSLLSEKYKTGKSNFLRAFKIGWKSNRYATVSGNYSSLIYVLTK